jgi:uncharacterized protein (DUF1810 family)
VPIERFRDAQNAPVAGFAAARDELRSGAKRSHWIWYMFPQLAGLGRSDHARRFALAGEAEAAEYLRDPELRARYLTIATVVAEQLRSGGTSLRALMGSDIDATKLVSSLTLFRHVARTLQGDDDYAAIDRVADAILTHAAEQGYPPCAETLRRIRS